MNTSDNSGFLGHTYFLSQDSVLYLCARNSCAYYLSVVQKTRRESIFASVALPKKISQEVFTFSYIGRRLYYCYTTKEWTYSYLVGLTLGSVSPGTR